MKENRNVNYKARLWVEVKMAIDYDLDKEK